MRKAFIEELVTLAGQHPALALIVGDLGFSVVESFVEAFPDRFINAGVAEQNMTGLAAGMASEGYHVLTYSIANFPTFRCAEQFRNDVDYLNLPVTVVAVGGGLAYGALGYSHHAVQDMALMRLMPNTVIAAPGDPVEVRACLQYLVDSPGPSYLRLGKTGEKSYHSGVPMLAPGNWQMLRQGTKNPSPRIAIVTTGAMMQNVMAWSGDPALAGCAIYSVPLWGMASKPAQADQARKFDLIITLEDHFVDGGFGSWMREALAQHFHGTLITMGLNPIVRNMVGDQETMNSAGGLNLEALKSAMALIDV